MATGNVDQDEEAMWRSLEDDDDAFNSQYREERVHKLTGAITNLQNMRDYKFGLLSEETEKEIISQTAKFKHCIVSFYHPDFRRCGIMNAHLQTLAAKFFSTKFFKIEVESAPFLVEKLKIKVLPCVVCFIDGVSVDRVIGFEELGDVDTFPTRNLEKRLMKSGAIYTERSQTTNSAFNKPILGGAAGDDSDDDY